MSQTHSARDEESQQVTGSPSRLDRRKTRTRQALIDAARQILMEKGSSDVSIQELTDLADVGFGSFYNHFTTKTELFEQAVGDILEEHGEQLDRATVDMSDPAEVFATSVRITVQLATNSPEVARVFSQGGLRFLIQDRGLAPRALRDIRRGIESGRFVVANPKVALACAAGCLFAFLQLRLEDPPSVADSDGDELAEQLLRMFGVPADSAHEIAHRSLP